jgi:hypothetical protein
MRVNSQAVVKASGSMMQATGKAFLTGTRGLRRSITKPPPGKPVKLVILIVAAVIRESRIYHEGVEIERVLVLRIEGALNGVVVIALLEEASGAAMQGNRATAAVRAVRACLREEAVAGLVVVAAAVAAVVVAAAVVAAVAAVVVGSRT